MNLREYKQKIKMGASMVLSIFPAYNVGKYFYDIHKMRKMYASSQAELDRINNMINSLPHDQAAHQHFMETGDSEVVQMFNTNLPNSMSDGTLSNGFMEKYGVESVDGVNVLLDSLYGQAHDPSLSEEARQAAKEAYNTLATDYQNDAFNQAAEQTGQQLMDSYLDLDVGTMDLSFTDAIMTADYSQTLFAFASILGVLFFISYAYENSPRGQRKAMVKKARKEKRQAEKKAAKMEKRKFKTSKSKDKVKGKSTPNKINANPKEMEYIVLRDSNGREIKYIKNENSMNITTAPTDKDDKPKEKDNGLTIF